jgi:hypothetical protein
MISLKFGKKKKDEELQGFVVEALGAVGLGTFSAVVMGAGLAVGAVALSAVDWYGLLPVSERQRILRWVGRAADRFKLPRSIGCALRRHASIIEEVEKSRGQSSAEPSPGGDEIPLMRNAPSPE